MEKPAGLLTAEEHREAVKNADNGRAKTLQSGIDGLLREKDKIEKWAVIGSA